MRFSLLVLIGALIGLAMASGSASAEVDGPCQFTVAGQDVAALDSSDRSTAIQVGQNDTVAYALDAQAGIVAWETTLSLGPYTRTIADGESPGGETSISDEVLVGDFTWLGVGLYTLEGSLELANGETCTGAALFSVDGNPLTTVIGGSAAGATALGAAGIGHATWSGYTAASQGAGFFKP